MEPAILSGLGTALVTPFHTDGSLDLASLTSLVEWQIASGVDFLVACGSTGEAATLREDETAEVTRTVIAAARDRVPVFAGCTHNSTAEAVHRAKDLAALPGVRGILTANPYYNKPNQQGQYLHFKAIAEAVSVPVLLYNIPGRTAANLEPATALRLAQDLPNIVGVKESSGSMQQISELISLLPRTAPVFAGDDYLALPVMAAGGAGLVSVASNIAPEPIARMVHAARAGDFVTARKVAQQFASMNQALFSEPNPAPAKAVLKAMGRLSSDALRLPLIAVADATRARLEKLTAELGLL